MIRLLRRLGAIGKIVKAYNILRRDVQDVFANPEIRAAWDRFRKDPAVAPAYPRISAEWRAVEEAVNELR